jgi:hypothetical protein
MLASVAYRRTLYIQSVKETQMDTIEFREADHSYWAGKKRIPGVTDILKKVGLTKSYEGVDPFYAQRGVATHLANELWMNGKLDEGSLDPQIKPFHMAFRKYVDKTGYKPVDVERVFYHPDLGYACRIDYYGDGLLVDAKCTKSHDRGADYQLCLQAAGRFVFALAEDLTKARD